MMDEARVHGVEEVNLADQKEDGLGSESVLYLNP
jgi:hypothetical protein